MRSLNRRFAIAVLFALLIGAHANGADPSVLIRTLPGGGVADETGKIGYVVGKNDDIEALDLETGKVLWISKEAKVPLAVAGKKLIALAPAKGKDKAAQIVILDSAQDGKKVLESEVIVLPNWVPSGAISLPELKWPIHLSWEGAAPSWDYKFKISLDANDLIYKWRAAKYSPKFQPGRPTGLKVDSEAHGAARINLKSGKVELLADEKVPSDSPKVPKELESVKSEPCRVFSEEIDRFASFKTIEKTTPISIGNGFVALVKDQENTRLSLKRWDASGKALATVEMLKHTSLSSLLKTISTDGRHLIVANQQGTSLWIFSLETGKQVAKFTDPSFGIWTAIVGKRAIDFDGDAYKSYDLESGKLVWKHRIREDRTPSYQTFYGLFKSGAGSYYPVLK